MNLQQIIDQADVLVPNEVTTFEKVSQLNAINQDFFNVVKIPNFYPFVAIKGQSSYICPSSIRFKNIKFVTCGVVKYKELNNSIANPMTNTYSFEDGALRLNLNPPPYAEGLTGSVSFDRIAENIFSSDVLTDLPDAPLEYHFTYVLALASFLANTQDDGAKAANYENQYKSAWNVAAQNYAKEVTV